MAHTLATVPDRDHPTFSRGRIGSLFSSLNGSVLGQGAITCDRACAAARAPKPLPTRPVPLRRPLVTATHDPTPVAGVTINAAVSRNDLMSTAQVAACFNRSPRTVRNWVKVGFLTPVRIGRAVFFRAAEVEHLATFGVRSALETTFSCVSSPDRQKGEFSSISTAIFDIQKPAPVQTDKLKRPRCQKFPLVSAPCHRR